VQHANASSTEFNNEPQTPNIDTRECPLADRLLHAGSSRGRGSRAASWFADYCAGKDDSSVSSLALAGGIKGWAEAGEQYVKMMDGYSAEPWTGEKIAQ
jgi:hypothetical protein